VSETLRGPLEDGVSEDRLLGGRVRLLQLRAGYRAAIDPLLLAAAIPALAQTASPHSAPPNSAGRVLDLGCGAGAAALCLLARLPGSEVVGLELQAELVALARRNAELNAVADRFRIEEGDVLALPGAFTAAFDHVLCNPPYLPGGAATVARDAGRAAANLEGAAGLVDWIGAALTCLKPKGCLTLVHRADRLPELLAALAGRAGEVRLLPLWPGKNKAAKRVILRARKASKAPARLLPGLLLHDSEGRYTAEAEAVLREAAALNLAR